MISGGLCARMALLASIVNATSPLPISRESIERLYFLAPATSREERQLRVGCVDHEGCYSYPVLNNY
jgi:hypothetical protein